VFFFPTTVKKQADKTEVAAMKIDFFGVKGKVQDDESLKNDQSLITNFKNNGETSCQISITENNGSKVNDVVVSKVSSANTFSFLQKNEAFLSKVPLSVTTVYCVKFKDTKNEKKVSIQSESAKDVRSTYQKFSGKKLDLNQIENFQQLIRVQNEITSSDTETIVSKIGLEKFILELVNENQSISQFEHLLKVLLNIPDFSNRILEIMCKNVPRLCE